MKVEVENTDCDEICEAYPDSFWVATVLRISGYRALLRYEGFGHSVEKDFWVSLCSNDIHPVGWYATIGKPLIPPNSKLKITCEICLHENKLENENNLFYSQYSYCQ